MKYNKSKTPKGYFWSTKMAARLIAGGTKIIFVGTKNLVQANVSPKHFNGLKFTAD